ncbi:hypothetical protein J1N35_008166 [Gossypium stocksii]|uniref:Reverse transcriptase n=1 Tax=Gossypium stocksii TaxID=47602 RepID=A0A9D3W8S6_9ROSI|nr:hypothetical protein J1N35_008166 [Gossypium stocksii]
MEADREELFWGQRARMNWLHYGDHSTSFYHKLATFRKHLNSVSSFVDDDSRTCPDIDAMFGVATKYFQGFFISSRSENFDNLLNVIEVCITPSMKGVLLSNFIFQEIRSIIDGMSPLKALGRDGFSALFFQRYWHIIGADIVYECFEGSFLFLISMPQISFFFLSAQP